MPENDLTSVTIGEYPPGSYDSPHAGRTPAAALRRAFEEMNVGRNLTSLQYERRAVTPGPTRHNRETHAVFLGLRMDGTVKAVFSLVRGGTSKHWISPSHRNCAGVRRATGP